MQICGYEQKRSWTKINTTGIVEVKEITNI
jgi:hypothetical protein